MTPSDLEPTGIRMASDHGGHGLAWELVETILAARASGEERQRRRLDQSAELERWGAP